MKKRIILISIITLVLLSLSTTIVAEGWTLRNPLPTPNELYDVTWTGEKFIAIGEMGTILSSTDGKNWTVIPCSFKGYFKCIAQQGDRIVIGGDAGYCMISEDKGLSWEVINTNSTQNHFLNLIYTDTFFLAASFKKVLYSNDGRKWEVFNMPEGELIRSTAWNGKEIIGIGTKGKIYRSVDGKNWEVISDTKGKLLSNIFWDGKKFIAAGRRTIIYSSDGVNWTESNIAIEGMDEINKVTYHNGTYIAVGHYGATHDKINHRRLKIRNKPLETLIFTSKDGVDWKEVRISEYRGLYSICYGNSTFVAVGRYGTLLTSKEGDIWNINSQGTIKDYRTICWDGTTLTAAGHSGALMTSKNDGATWELDSLPTKEDMFASCYTGKELYIGGRNEVLVKSKNSNTWKKVPHNFDSSTIMTITHHHDSLLICGGFKNNQSRLFIKNLNTSQWNSLIPNEGTMFFDIVNFKGAYYIAAEYLDEDNNYSGEILKTTDFITYEVVYSTSLDIFEDIIVQDSVLIAVGFSPNVLISYDGNSWEENKHGTTDGFNQTIWTGREFITVGGAGGIYSSKTGWQWKQIHFASFNGLTSIVQTDKALVTVGFDGIIYTTPYENSNSIEPITLKNNNSSFQILHTSHNLIVNSHDLINSVALYNLLGKKVMEKKGLRKKSLSISKRKLSKGAYYMLISDIYGNQIKRGVIVH